jgi:hypothetical protein
LWGAGQLVGCGGDDTSNPANESDASADGATSPDGTSGSNDGSASSGDGSMQGDGGSSGADAGDAQMTNGGDASDGGVEAGDAAFVCPIAVPSEDQFFSAVAAAFCQSLSGCCNLGAKFDTAGCHSAFGDPSFGGYLAIASPLPYVDGGRIAYDTEAACHCLEAAGSVNCGTVTQQTLASIQQTCIAALHGTVPNTVVASGDAGVTDAGASGDAAVLGCASSFECATGYCSVEYPSTPAADAGLGTCAALVGDGGACGNLPSELERTKQDQCSYLGNGQPELYCASSNTCAPRIATGSQCTSNSQCALNACQIGPDGGSPLCISGQVFASAPTCVHFTLPDGG